MNSLEKLNDFLQIFNREEGEYLNLIGDESKIDVIVDGLVKINDYNKGSISNLLQYEMDFASFLVDQLDLSKTKSTYLDYIAQNFYGITRQVGETDDEFYARIILQIFALKCSPLIIYEAIKDLGTNVRLQEGVNYGAFCDVTFCDNITYFQNFTFTRLTDPIDVPANGVVGCSFSSDDTYLAVVSTGNPQLIIYKRTGDTFTKLADPTSIPTIGSSYDCQFSPDNSYLVLVNNGNSPEVFIYKRNQDVFTAMINPLTLPASAYRCAWSPDGTYLAFALETNPQVAIYKRVGDVFTLLTNPVSLPAGGCTNCCFDPSGTYLVFTCNSAPYFVIYKRTGDTFTKLADPLSLPTGAGEGCSFTPDSGYLAIASNETTTPLRVYRRVNDTFTKIADITGLPTTSGSYYTSYSSDGIFLAISYDDSPYVYTWQRSGEVYTQLSDPDVLPLGASEIAIFSHNRNYLIAGSDSSPYLNIYKMNSNIVKEAFCGASNGLPFFFRILVDTIISENYIKMVSICDDFRVAGVRYRIEILEQYQLTSAFFGTFYFGWNGENMGSSPIITRDFLGGS